MPNTTVINDVMSLVIEINCKNSLCQSESGFERNSIFESDISDRVLKLY